MKTLVLKFGGASVATENSFLQIASIISERVKQCHSLVTVVSAMGNTTDSLLAMAKKIHSNPPKREQDMLISAGERISIALLAMALKEMNIDAISLTGSQSGIITCARHSDARIIDVRPNKIVRSLREGKVAIVAGFQGMGLNGEITTLGRGGSDTTAVALASALSAQKVEFYKDVEGIYNQDPKKDPAAKKYDFLSYDEAITISHSSSILHTRSLELAKTNQVPLQVLSFLQFQGNDWIEKNGTKIGSYHSLSTINTCFELREKNKSMQEGVCV